jgi:hypothetical protein
MQRNCSACHSLTFDNFNGVNRTLPHGQPQLVVATMLDFYKAAATDVARGAVGDERRLPGQAAIDRTAQMRNIAFTQADSRAADRIRAIFSPGGSCYGCHAIIKPTSGLNYGVAPVVLQQHFLPRTPFDHKAHMTAGMTCEQCHAARKSQSAADVLMPWGRTCRSQDAFALRQLPWFPRRRSQRAGAQGPRDGDSGRWAPQGGRGDAVGATWLAARGAYGAA